MHLVSRRAAGAVAVLAVTALALTGCAGSASSTTASTKTLVVDKTFDLKTSDPARAFELTGSIVDKALYETALTFTGSDVTKPVPQLATAEESADNKVLTLTLHGKHSFSNGDPVTIDDIVWSYQRVEGIAGSPTFLLLDPGDPTGAAYVKVAKTSATTMTLTSTAANPQLEYILPNPSLGVLDSKLLKQHGGTTTKTDGAEQYLNQHSAGSGPYQLTSYAVKSKVVMGPNTKYVGTKPTYGRIVLQNVAGSTQKINVTGGQAQVALDLNSDQVKGLGTGSTKVVKNTSPDVMYSWLNQDPKVSAGVTDKAAFVTAVRRGIDYAAVRSFLGSGSVQPGGIVPSQFLGSLKSDPTNTFDLAAAKAALAKSGYSGQAIKFSYPSDGAPAGVDFGTLAQLIQSQLKTVGITLTLAPQPFTSFIDAYRKGTLQAGIMYWGPDYPDPADYTVFSPGDSLGLRAGWTKTAATAVTDAKNAATAASGPDARAAAYTKWQQVLNEQGPFIPIVQPSQYLTTTSAIKSIVPNAIWTIDPAAVK